MTLDEFRIVSAALDCPATPAVECDGLYLAQGTVRQLCPQDAPDADVRAWGDTADEANRLYLEQVLRLAKRRAPLLRAKLAESQAFVERVAPAVHLLASL
jgi:hypothetical protein